MVSKVFSQILIRKAKPEDMESIVQITAEAFEGYTVSYLLEKKYGVKFGGKPWREWKGAELKAFCENSLDRVYVAELNGVVVGYMTYNLDRAKRIGSVGNNAVSPAYQRRGIATNLLKAVLETFKEEGMGYAQVGTMEIDIPARRLYEKAGFEELSKSVYYFMKL